MRHLLQVYVGFLGNATPYGKGENKVDSVASRFKREAPGSDLLLHQFTLLLQPAVTPRRFESFSGEAGSQAGLSYLWIMDKGNN